MHNAAFDALGLNWRYMAFDVEPSKLGVTLQGLATANVVGVNLTVPHKILAMRHVDRMDLSVQKIKATNTLHFVQKKNKTLIQGYNTDGYGLLKALKESFSFRPKDKTIAMVGCGGAGQGAAIQCALSGARKLILLNRTRSKAVALARRIQTLRTKTICSLKYEPCDLVIQATSLGLNKSDPLPLSLSELKLLQPLLLLDMIYRPAETPIMRLAAKLGCKVSNGIGMLLHQGAKSFEIWTHQKAPLKVMRQALHREIYGSE